MSAFKYGSHSNGETIHVIKVKKAPSQENVQEHHLIVFEKTEYEFEIS